MSDDPLTAQEARGELYDRIRMDVPFEEKAREALDLGRRYLGADNGHLTRIDRETDHWEAMISTDSAGGRFPPGLELDLETTYCRRTIAAGTQTSLHDAPNQGWEDDDAFDTHGLCCYHGTTFVLDGEPYGTVCFVADEPRDEPFSDGETMFTELITRLLERELEREHHEAELTRQANLATVLNRVLRHNLRNDLAIIRGHTQVMADELGPVADDSTALHHIDDLIDLSRKARELDRIVATEFEREPADVVTLVEEVADSVAGEYPAASISVEFDERITASVMPSFERAVEELIENAAKHGSEDATVVVVVETVPNAIELRIMDDGPGLDDDEADVLATGTETPLIHGSGLGLWLVHWIVTSHDGTVEPTVADGGTTMTISIPRKSATDAHRQLTELVRARDQYQAAFEEANDAMVIIDDDVRIVEANRKATDVYGITRRELLGRSLSNLLPDEFDFEAARREFRKDERERVVLPIADADGERRPLECTVTTDIVPGQHMIVSRDVGHLVE